MTCLPQELTFPSCLHKSQVKSPITKALEDRKSESRSKQVGKEKNSKQISATEAGGEVGGNSRLISGTCIW